MSKDTTIPPPENIVAYETADGVEGGALYLYGNPDASNIVVCCAGYPDDHSIFQPFASRLANEGECLVGVMCLPGFDDRKEKPWRTHKKDGYSFDEMAISVRGAVKALRGASTCKDAKFTSIFHDWGVLIGSIWINRVLEEEESPELQPDQVVHFDVLLQPHKVMLDDLPDAPKKRLYRIVVEMVYKIVLACGFLLHQYVSEFLAVIFFNIGGAALDITYLKPLHGLDVKVLRANKKSVNRCLYMAYPYWYLIEMIFQGSIFNDDISIHKDLKKTPLLYMYGAYKRAHFHNNVSLALLEREEREGRSKTKVVRLEDDGHFFYVTNEDVCLEAVISFIKD